mgnify:CR=1 FL=1
MGELEKIYYEYQNNLAEGDSEEVIAARKSLYNFFDKKGLDSFEYEDFIVSLSCENEKQGFIAGFKYAMKIALECMQTKTT